MEESSFFNDVDGDKEYFAEDFAEYFIPFFTNGIFNNGCQVLGNTNDMAVNLSVGRAFIEGYRYRNKKTKTLIIENADGVLNRIDNIVIRLDLTNRNITTQVIKGTFANNPIAPDLVRTSTIYDLRIAQVSIPAGTTEITQDLVKDCRFITSDCGNVISPIKTPDTEQLFIQIQAIFDKFIADNKNDFDTWFKYVKNQLSTDVAGNLQNKIGILENLDTINKENLVDSINEVNQKPNNILKMLGLDKDTYSNSKTYKKGDLVIHDNKIYECTAESTKGDFDNLIWEFVPVFVDDEE